MEGKGKKASPVKSSCGGMTSELPVDEVLSKLVQSSPKASVVVAGVQTMCVLDTGAETSLISASFYRENLAEKMGRVKPVGTYLRVFGAGGLEVPIEGYIEVPLCIYNSTVVAHFLVVKDPSNAKFMQGQCPVLLGCNVLRLLKDLVIEPGHRDAEAWSLTLQWYKHTRGNDQQQTHDSSTYMASGKNVPVRTGRTATTIFPREVRSIPCYVRAQPDTFKGCTVLVESLSRGVDEGCTEERPSTHNLGPNCRVYSSCDVTNGRIVNVVVANMGTQSIEIPPHTGLAMINEVFPKSDIELEEREDGIHVSVNDLLVEATGCGSMGSEELNYVPDIDSELGMGGEPPTGEVYVFQDGTEYQFPNGLSLAGSLEMSAEDKDRVVRLIQKHDAVFSKGSLDLGTCDKIPHKIVTSDEQPPNQPYRRIPHITWERLGNYSTSFSFRASFGKALAPMQVQ